ncbi:MAG: MBL fold metallo-hydrolase, partial [Alphaproteobacteria bacterium]
AREAFEVENGDVLRLAPGPAAVVAQVPAGRLCLDGARVVPFGGKVVRDRQKLLFNGAAVATIVLGADRMLAAPLQLSLQGVLEEEAWDSAREAAETAVKAALEATVREGDDVRREAARRAIRRSLFQATGRKPMTDIHLLHLPNA